MAVLEIAFDESDQPARISGIDGIWPMMMLHCRLWWRPQGSNVWVKHELVLPPAFLLDTTAATLAINAVHSLDSRIHIEGHLQFRQHNSSSLAGEVP
jgi:hypothetical protein